MLTATLLAPRLPQKEADQPPLPGDVGLLVSSLDAVVQAYRRTRPEEGSEDEQRLLLDFARASLRIMEALGPGFFAVVREQLDPALKSAWKCELESVDEAKKFAVHQLGRALESFGVVLEAVAREMEGLPAEAAKRLGEVNGALLLRPDAPLDSDTRQLLRWQADLVTALASLDADAQELAYWATRAARGARSVQALLAGLSPRRERGDAIFREAQQSWNDWDDPEIGEELRPWDGD